MNLAAKMYATATTLLSKYGQAITITRDNTVYNPSTGAVLENDTDSYNGVGYPAAYAAIEVDGTLVRQDDTRLIFSSKTKPELNDVFTVGNKKLTALSIQNITVSGSNVVYIVQLRQ